MQNEKELNGVLRIADVPAQLREKGEAVLEIHTDGRNYIRVFKPKERLIICGGGNVGQEIGRYAAELGFYVVAVDDRPEFASSTVFPGAKEIYCDHFVHALKRLSVGASDYVTVVTRGHQFDLECLRYFLQGHVPGYLGMMASRKRAAGVREMLSQEGFREEDIARIHMPIGISIGALTPREIGLSIAAELIACRRKHPSGMTHTDDRAVKLVCEDTDEKLMDFLERDQNDKALLVVCEASGSTPAKPGAMMAVNRGFQTAGTIGGGCAEGIALREAFKLIGTGETKMISLDMNNDVAAEAGMACGGRMKVWIADILI
ncbi:MAG: XdhC family protein [Clostridiales bacterium]|nr:XdhC family protein [Clostridiales bacterium]